MNTSWSIVIIVAAITGTVFGFVAFGHAIPDAASQQDDKAKTIRIDGDASRSLEPDQVTIFMSIQGEQADATTAITAQQEAIEKVRQAIESTGTDSEVKVGSVSLSPFTTYDNGISFGPDAQPVPSNSSYIVTAVIPVKIALDELPAVAADLKDAGQEVSNIYTYPEYFYTDEGEIDYVSYIAEIMVVITTGPAPLEEAVSQYQEAFQDLKSMLAQAGISASDIVPSEISVEPEGVYSESFSSESVAYQAYSNIIVTTAMESIDEVVAAAQGAGATPQSLVPSISDSRIEEARKELAIEALDNARDRASDVAGSLGMEVKDVISIEVASNVPASQSGGYVDPFQILYSGLSAGTEMAVTVTAEFEIG